MDLQKLIELAKANAALPETRPAQAERTPAWINPRSVQFVSAAEDDEANGRSGRRVTRR